MKTTVKEFKANGNTYTVKMIEVSEKINANGGAAPWMVGTKTKVKKYSLEINGDDVCSIGMYKEDKALIEIGQMFGY
jgi:hypothetical protein